MPLIVDASTTAFDAKLGAAVAATEPRITVQYERHYIRGKGPSGEDRIEVVVKQATTEMAGVTPTEVVPDIDISDTTKHVTRWVQIRNNDTSDIALTITFDVSSETITFYAGDLAPGEIWRWPRDGEPTERFYPLSGMSSGQPIEITDTATPGQTVHTSAATSNASQLVWLYANNTHVTDSSVVHVEWAGDGASNEPVSENVRATAGAVALATGFPLIAGGTIKVWAATTSVIKIFGMYSIVNPQDA